MTAQGWSGLYQFTGGVGVDYTIQTVTHLQQSPDSEKGDSGSVFSDKGDGQRSKSLSSSI